MKPYYEDGAVTIYHGDCREVAPAMGNDFALVADPPYGMNWDGRVSIGPNGQGRTGTRSWSYGKTVHGDSEPFDPSEWLRYPSVTLWGCNHYANLLPIGTTLVWVKRYDPAFGSYLSDAEVAWSKGGHGVYCFRDTGYKSEGREHPTQKPLSLMEWCVSRTPMGLSVLDPFMGSGTTLVAAKNLGRQAIGIEIEERYCEIAAQRCSQEVLAL